MMEEEGGNEGLRRQEMREDIQGWMVGQMAGFRIEMREETKNNNAQTGAISH